MAWAQMITPISPFRVIQPSSVPSLAAGLAVINRKFLGKREARVSGAKSGLLPQAPASSQCPAPLICFGKKSHINPGMVILRL